MQPLTDRFRAGRQEKEPAQHLADAFDAQGRILPLDLDNLVGDGSRQARLSWPGHSGLQARFPAQAIGFDPVFHAALADPHRLADNLHAVAFVQMQPDGLEFFLRAEPALFFRAGPPRGAPPLLLYYNVFIHVNTPSIFGVSTPFLLNSVSRSGR